MPCDSSYMEPTAAEENRRQVSSLICFVDSKLGVETPKNIKKAAKHIYGEGVDLDTITEQLCSKLSNLTKKQADAIIYNARDKRSRELADWWEEHIEADKKRLQKELKAKKDAKTKAEAIKKLTPHERKVLGIK